MSRTITFAVAGATGRLGRHIVDVLTERGYETVPMSRACGVDIVTGQGLAEALTGVDVIIDAASWPASDQQAAAEFFHASTRALHEAGRKAGVSHIVVASVIGADRFAAGFLAAKQVHEQLSLAGPLPARILRAAQFHEYVAEHLDRQQDGVAHIPAWPSQPVSARTVAEALADLALSPDAPAHPTPETPIPEIAGPRKETLAEAAALLGARRGIRVIAVDTPDANDPDAETYAGGGLLPSPHAKLAGPSFEEWVASRG
ncbi:SDR family oxidoreductase [Streptomyces camelliae]|uniref:NAD(P)H-binding protein n=1 Tax=Streptomyces camelliae TaxID=3004093 RepID=A0ABY7PGA1_9ACTN|nr:NAD(P)H-binding protein [Streptomyces sp. HUAS 2-6]WBO69653.1 NAD(P)H-binding protein [Streptomyces sp. HUAS 2-6]